MLRSLLLCFAWLLLGPTLHAQECVTGPIATKDTSPEIEALKQEQRAQIEEIRLMLASEEAKPKQSKAALQRISKLRGLYTEIVEAVEREDTTKQINKRTVLEPYCAYYVKQQASGTEPSTVAAN